MGTGLRQAIFERELEKGIERSLWRKIEKREKQRRQKVKEMWLRKNGRKKKLKKRGVVLVRRQKISLPHMYTLIRSKN